MVRNGMSIGIVSPWMTSGNLHEFVKRTNLSLYRRLQIVGKVKNMLTHHLIPIALFAYSHATSLQVLFIVGLSRTVSDLMQAY